MIKKTIIFLMLVIFSSSIFAYTINTITITPLYTNSSGNINFTGTTTDAVLNEQVQLTVKSNKDTTGIDFNIPIVNNMFSGSFNVDINGTSSSGTIPTIGANAFDTIILRDKFVDVNDSVIVDSIKPVNSARLTISPLGGNSLNFYSGSINISYNPVDLSDVDSSGISNHIISVVPVAEINNYLSATRKFINANTDNNKTINSLSPVIADGNYFVVIDANDMAANYSLSSEVLETKQNVYFDNTIPTLSTVTIGTTARTIDANRIYIPDSNFSLSVLLSDISGINPASTLTVIRPDNHPISSNYIDTNGFVISSENIGVGLWGDGNIFRVSIDANDNLNNRYTYDFNIIIDTAKPTRPNRNTTTIEDVDKNVTITWAAGTSTDAGSGLKEYRVYRSTSTFAAITTQTLVCTTGTTTYTCKDTTEKNLNTILYYGLVGVDNSGNISDANTQLIWTGPDCDIEINDGNKYTKSSSVNIAITYSNDVNQVAFSCNGTSFSSYQDLDDNEVEDTKTFTITSGNGCTTTNEQKTIYARVKGHDNNNNVRTTICSSRIYYDTTPPSVPNNIITRTLANGHISLSWPASTDTNTDSIITYKIYYSLDSNNVTSSSSFFTTTDNSYIHNPNKEIRVYYKLSSTDEAGNESALSSTVTGIAKKIGPKFSISVLPSNDINNTIYVNSGLKNIEFISDRSLLSNPQVSVKQSTDAYVTLVSTYSPSTKKGTATFNFTKSGIGIIKIFAIDTNNETSITELELIIDINAPIFDYNYSMYNSTFTFILKDYSNDIYRAEYILNNTEIICLKQVTDSNFNCIFDSNNTQDGNHTISMLIYDKALNVTRKDFRIVIDNVDEDKIDATILKTQISILISNMEDNIQLFESLDLLKKIDKSQLLKLDLAKADKSDGDALFYNSKFLAAKEKYISAKNTIDELNIILPKINIIQTKKTEIIYDENTTIPENLVYDANILSKTLDLYKNKKITIIRSFDIMQIDNLRFFSVTLQLKNNTAEDLNITIIEDVPKSFSNHINYLSFTEEVVVLDKDPIFKYSTTLLEDEITELSYRYMKPITEVDSVTKYNTIQFSNPMVLEGIISREKINIKQSVDKNIFIYLISIIFLFILILIIINTISDYKNKHTKIIIKPEVKKEMGDYLGNIDKENKDNKELNSVVKEVSNSTDKFQENYEYILSAIKKR